MMTRTDIAPFRGIDASPVTSAGFSARYAA